MITNFNLQLRSLGVVYDRISGSDCGFVDVDVDDYANMNMNMHHMYHASYNAQYQASLTSSSSSPCTAHIGTSLPQNGLEAV